MTSPKFRRDRDDDAGPRIRTHLYNGRNSVEAVAAAVAEARKRLLEEDLELLVRFRSNVAEPDPED